MVEDQNNDAIAQTAQWLARLEQDRDQVLDGLHDMLGNFGTTHEHIEGILDGADSALFAIRERLIECQTQQKTDRRALKRLKAIDAMLSGIWLACELE